MAERDLAVLLRRMKPVLPPLAPYPSPSGFDVAIGALPFRPFAAIAEADGLTAVARLAVVRLAVVRLAAAFAEALAVEEISCNVIAGVHHDQLFVPWGRRAAARAALHRVSHD